MEERHGHEEHLKLTQQVFGELKVEMDNLNLQKGGVDSMRGSLTSAGMRTSVAKAASNNADF